jgi:IS605 OrfB family transposase
MSEVTLESPVRADPDGGSRLGAILAAVGDLWGRLERKLFKRLHADGQPDRARIAAAKREFIAVHRLSARQFNGMRMNLEGKVEAWRESRKNEKERLSEALGKLGRRLAKLRSDGETLGRRIAAFRASGKLAQAQPLQDRRSRISFQLHQKQRRRHALERRLGAAEAALAGPPALCFGGRALFRQQFQLQANGFENHEAWLKAWRARRTSQFFAVGSRGEVCGNGECQFQPERGVLSLRLPHALEGRFGKRLEVPVDFHRETELLASLAAGRAISYRFLRREDGRWVVLATTVREPAPVVTRVAAGAVGADFNVDHVAVADVDRSGNLVGHRRIDLEVRGLSSNQAKARIGDAAADLVGQAKAVGKPLVIEALDFRKKKAALRELGKRQALTLSGFAFAQFQERVASRCEREGVALIRVNPAFTSVIGYAKFGNCRISPHGAAAMAIARRGLGFGERLATRNTSPRLGTALRARLREIALGRKACEHVWKAWRAFTPWLRAALRRPRSARGGGASHPDGDSSPPVIIRPSGGQGFWTPAVPAVGTAAPGSGRTKGRVN